MTAVHAEEALPHIDLAISFDLETATLIGTARVRIPPDTAVSFDLTDLSVTGSLLSQVDRENIPLAPDGGRILSIPHHQSPQTLFISWEKQV